MDPKALRDLLYFVQIVEYTSLNMAAQKLNASRVTLGRFLQQLEADLGQRLVRVDHEGMKLTQAGKSIYNKFKPIADNCYDEMKGFFGQSQEHEGVVKIIAPETYLDFWNGAQLLAFKQKYPGIHLDIYFGNALIVPSDPYRFDLVITGGLPSCQNFYINKLSTIRSELFCHEEYANKYGLPTTIDELRRHQNRMIMIPPASSKRISDGNRSELGNTVVIHSKQNNKTYSLEPQSNITATGFNASLFINSKSFIAETVIHNADAPKYYVPVLPNYYVKEFNMYLLRSQFATSKVVSLVSNLITENIID